MQAVNSPGKKGNMESKIRREVIGVKRGWASVVRVRGFQCSCVDQQSCNLCWMGFHGVCSNVFGHRIQSILCLFKIIALGVYWPYHEVEITKALYLLKKIPFL